MMDSCQQQLHCWARNTRCIILSIILYACTGYHACMAITVNLLSNYAEVSLVAMLAYVQHLHGRYVGSFSWSCWVDCYLWKLHGNNNLCAVFSCIRNWWWHTRARVTNMNYRADVLLQFVLFLVYWWGVIEHWNCILLTRTLLVWISSSSCILAWLRFILAMDWYCARIKFPWGLADRLHAYKDIQV